MHLKKGDVVLILHQQDESTLGIFFVNTVAFGDKNFLLKPRSDSAPFPTVGDVKGSEAQGNKNARAWFGNHIGVNFQNKYYDPAYGGESYDKAFKWEDAAIQRYGAQVEVTEFNGNTFIPSTPKKFYLYGGIKDIKGKKSQKTRIQVEK